MKYLRECICIYAEEPASSSVLVVSADEDRQSFRSDVCRFKDVEEPPATVFEIDGWISYMWVSDSGTYFLAGVLGECFTNMTGTFVGQRATNQRLFRIWGLHDRAVYAVGEDGTCVHFNGSQWTDMNGGLAGHLYAIKGTDERNLVCAGDNGFVARYDGSGWQQIELPTNAAFRDIHIINSDELLICGLDGACFRLRGGELLPIDGDTHDYYSIAEFQGDIYFGSAASGVFKLEGDRLSLVKDKAKGYSLSPAKEYLWTCGLEQTARFDGENWRKVDFY